MLRVRINSPRESQVQGFRVSSKHQFLLIRAMNNHLNRLNFSNFMSLMKVLLVLGLISGARSSVVADDASSTPPRPNILWIVCDDLGPDLKCYRARNVNTPAFDRLAGEGIRFNRAFATAPVCSTSRSALITGRYQTEIGCENHRTQDKQPLPDNTVPITELFRRAGYFVCNSDAAFSKPGKTDYNFLHDNSLYDGIDWRQREGRPFFAQVQVSPPHRPFKKNKYPKRAERLSVPPYLVDHPVIRADAANYLQSVEACDRQVDRILNRLEADGLVESTIVMVFGDNGRPQMRAKQWLYEAGIHVPLIIRWPGHINGGTFDPRLVSLLDVSATTLAAAGIPLPDYMEGHDVLSDSFNGREYIVAARDRCDETVDRMRCLRTLRFKYIRNDAPDRPYMQFNAYKHLNYPARAVMLAEHERGVLTPVQAQFMAPSKPREELYDVEVDRYETNNLAGDPQYQKVLDRLRNQLGEWSLSHDAADKVIPQSDLKSSQAWANEKLVERGLPADASAADYVQWWAKELGVKAESEKTDE